MVNNQQVRYGFKGETLNHSSMAFQVITELNVYNTTRYCVLDSAWNQCVIYRSYIRVCF